jgi:CRISPR-associated protein Csb2
MPLMLEQSFPLGRFHATRWNQNPFEDPYGEWPPSPWRLLRALAARWFQYNRETGDSNTQLRDDLFRELARCPPDFYLPPASWRGMPELRQYHPTEVAWTDASANAAAYRKPKTTLVPDHYRAVPADKAVYWFWHALTLRPELLSLMAELIRRVLYFGRAESYCRFQVDPPHIGIQPNCTLRSDYPQGVPVLVPDPSGELRIDSLLANTDDELLAQRRIPPGTSWYYADIPPRPTASRIGRRPTFRENLTVIQFAIGGRVLPPLARWVKLTGRFRDRVVKARCRTITGNVNATYRDLKPDQRDRLALLSGKNAEGIPLAGHVHAFFLLLPDQWERPTRLICWREKPFSSDEVEAVLEATDAPYAWESGAPDWLVRIAPLPFETNRPPRWFGKSTDWQSTTPFVPPANRVRFRSNGRERPGEVPRELVRKLLIKNGFPEPVAIEIDRTHGPSNWVNVHQSPEERRRVAQERTTCARPGFHVRIQFQDPIGGPICLGHSCHLGLGLFESSRSERIPS